MRHLQPNKSFVLLSGRDYAVSLLHNIHFTRMIEVWKNILHMENTHGKNTYTYEKNTYTYGKIFSLIFSSRNFIKTETYERSVIRDGY